MIISHISHHEEIYLDERVKYIVSALQSIKKEPKANTVPENNCSVALNIDPKEIGPVARSQFFPGKIFVFCATNQSSLPIAAVNADMSPNAAWTAP